MNEIEKAIQWFEKSLVGSMALRDYELTNICKTSLAALREKLERQQNEPLTIEELREMDGEPVWVSCKPIEGGNGYWCLCRGGTITTPAASVYVAEEIPHWVLYRRPPEEGEDS